MTGAQDEAGLDVRIVSREETAGGIVILELAAVGGEALPPFEAGAHVDVHVGPGLVRQYSLSNAPHETHRYRLGVLRDSASRGGSEQVHRTFVPGRIVHISRPRCNFRLVAQARRSILVAGGIGITPLLCMAYGLQAARADFMLHYCVREQARTAFAAELAAPDFAGKVRLHYDDSAPAQRFVPADLPRAAADTHLYVCGPPGFIDFVTDSARQLGWQAAQIHIERFTAEVSAVACDAFTVVAAVSGVTVEVGPQQSIAQALSAAGVDVPLSCEQGICGTCLTRVVEGLPEHRDLYQTEEEKAANTHITPCCSRALGKRLVLEI